MDVAGTLKVCLKDFTVIEHKEKLEAFKISWIKVI